MSNEVIQETTPLVECSAFHRGMSVLEASLRNTEDSEAIINGLLKGAAEFYGASRASVVEADWELGIGVITYEWCKDGVPAQRDMLQCLPMEKFPRWRKSLRTNKPVVISDLQRLEKIYPDTDADGNLIRLTCDDFACAAEFQHWKDWSDSDLRKEENADHQQADNAISMEVLSEEATAVASIEDEYMEMISADEGAALVRLLGQGLSSHLTETQRRRLWKYCVEGKPVRLIAKEECAYRNAVWKSIQAAKEKMFNFFVETGCAKPRFRRDR